MPDVHTSVIMRPIHVDGGCSWDLTPLGVPRVEGAVHGLAIDGDAPPIHRPTALLMLVARGEEVAVACAELRLCVGDVPLQVLSVGGEVCQLAGRACAGVVAIQSTGGVVAKTVVGRIA